MQTIICIKWGDRYGIDYLNRLASMVRRNSSRETRLICFTEDGKGADPSVTIAPLPPINLPAHKSITPWRKLSLWQYPLGDLSGDVLFFDLDVVITGPIDDFFDYAPGRLCLAQNWTQPGRGIGNTSVYRFPVGKMSYIYDTFNADPDTILSRYRIEQQYVSAVGRDAIFFPPEWCLSFKHSLVPKWPLNFLFAPRLPAGTKVVAFHGKPDPDEARDGFWPVRRAYKKLYKYVRPTPWIAEHWR